MNLTLVLSIYYFWTGFQPIQNMKNSLSSGKRALGGKITFWPLGGLLMAQVLFKGLNFGKIIKAECLVLLLMFLSTLGHLLAFLPVRGFSVTIPTLVGGKNHTHVLTRTLHNVSLGN